jgi:hypothetical protein
MTASKPIVVDNEAAARQATARAVADAVVYEGYILYPYRASAQKNRTRWQFGVLMPADYADAEPNESAFSRTECVLEADDDAEITVVLRYLQVQRRTIRDVTGAQIEALDLDGASITAWDEAVEHQVVVGAALADLRATPVVQRFEAPEVEESEPVHNASGETVGHIVRRREHLQATLTIAATSLPGPWRATRLRVRVTNGSRLPDEPDTRDAALPMALVAVHTIVSARRGEFISMLEPPEWARTAVDECHNAGTFPVLAGVDGGRDVILSSPIILYDHPTIAAESPGDLYDATEIDEILTLRTLALTDAEKRAARITDPRAAAIIDRVDAMDAMTMDRLHGAIRYLRQVTGESPDDPGVDRLGGEFDAPPAETAPPPWWDPDADASVSPATDSVVVNGITVRRGSTVRLRPGTRRADAQDMFLVGRPATIAAVLFDIDDQPYFALTLDEDPSAELQRSHGRFLYFTPDEVEPI